MSSFGDNRLPSPSAQKHVDAPRRDPVLVVLSVLVLLLAIAGWWRAMPDTIDDAHITFRYVENLVSGHGLSFNPGERVEGFSNPLFVFLLVPFALLSIPLEIVARLIGLCSFGFCILAAWKLARHIGADARHAALSALAIAASFPLLYYSVTGMETGFFAALIAADLWRYYACGKRIEIGGALIWLAVALTRPEGVLYPVLLGLYELMAMSFPMSAAEPVRHRRSIGALAIVAVGVALFVLWRHWYFGAWLPNTYFAKQSTVFAGPSRLTYILLCLIELGTPLPILACLTLRKETIRECLPAWTMVLAGFVFAVYAGGDWMPAGRYLLPILVPLTVLAMRGLQAWTGSRPVTAIWPHAVTLVTMIFLLATSASVLKRFIDERERFPYHVLSSRTCREAAEAIRAEFGPDHTIVSVRVGALGRFSGMRVLDLFGLVDRDVALIIAQNPEYDPNRALGDDLPPLRGYLTSQHPDLVLALSPEEQGPPSRTLYGFGYRFHRSYRLGDDQWWHLYRRVD